MFSMPPLCVMLLPYDGLLLSMRRDARQRMRAPLPRRYYRDYYRQDAAA